MVYCIIRSALTGYKTLLILIVILQIFYFCLDWPYRDKFNNALLELQEQGVLAQLKQKWWNEVGAGVCNVSRKQFFIEYS